MSSIFNLELFFLDQEQLPDEIVDVGDTSFSGSIRVLCSGSVDARPSDKVRGPTRSPFMG